MSLTAGHSDIPLQKKLGISGNMKLLILNAPSDYPEWIDMKIEYLCVTEKEIPDFIHLFAKSIREFEREMKSIRSYYKRNTKLILWVSWYKKSAGILTDMNGDVIRKYALKNGLVDVKV